MMTRWSGTAHGAELKTSTLPPSASTFMTPMPWLLLKQPPPIFLTNSILLELADSASGLGLENRNPKLKKKANSCRIGLQNVEPDDVDGNEEVEDDDDDAVRGGGVAAIMEQKMSGNQRRDAGRLEREESYSEKKRRFFWELEKATVFRERKRGDWRTINTVKQIKETGNVQRSFLRRLILTLSYPPNRFLTRVRYHI